MARQPESTRKRQWEVTGQIHAQPRIQQGSRKLAAETVPSVTPQLPSSMQVRKEKNETHDKPFEAGRLEQYKKEWEKLTSDPFILQMIDGAEIPLSEIPKERNSDKNQVQGHLWTETDTVTEELLEMGVIKEAVLEKDEVVSPIFLVPKSDGKCRLILNLKSFNESVAYEHFKMEDLRTATNMMTKGCYMASVDLRHAYYSVRVNTEYQHYLKFKWRGKLYTYTCLPNGLSCCPRFFTKLLKPVYAQLRNKGFLSTAFIDDSYLQGRDKVECQRNIGATVKLFQSLGFILHDKKSVVKPTQKLRYLGFVLDSRELTVRVPEERADKIRKACEGLASKAKCTIRELAQVIG